MTYVESEAQKLSDSATSDSQQVLKPKQSDCRASALTQRYVPRTVVGKRKRSASSQRKGTGERCGETARGAILADVEYFCRKVRREKCGKS